MDNNQYQIVNNPAPGMPYNNPNIPPQNTLAQKERKQINTLFTIWLISLLTPIIISIITIVFALFQTTIPNSMDSLYEFLSLTYGGVYVIMGMIEFAHPIVAVIGKVKYPKNTKTNVMFWMSMAIVIIGAIISLTVAIFFAIACNSCMNDCG